MALSLGSKVRNVCADFRREHDINPHRLEIGETLDDNRVQCRVLQMLVNARDIRLPRLPSPQTVRSFPLRYVQPLQAPASDTRASNLPETVRPISTAPTCGLAPGTRYSETGPCTLFDCLIDQPLNRGIHLSKFKRFHETKWTKLRE